ncbi:DNA primase family protein [Salinimicrobium sediminilitoris]|uniref:DNA primase family protein n=1 Tax=Salinimicrobium sediminilitoris TaxID=2876715 RepID=UPI001E362709|nr:phage/plasmid primase, P4 family [Salinimicrobium sediminilitoris]MCC8358377.1 phage/plasmid primase, P4 family [Salinimicrobium sediminilitoris]
MTNIPKKDNGSNSSQKAKTNQKNEATVNNSLEAKSKDSKTREKPANNGSTAHQPLDPTAGALDSCNSNSTANHSGGCNGDSAAEDSITIDDLVNEAEQLEKKISLSNNLDFILQNLELKNFETEAEWTDDEKPLPRKYFVVLSIQFIIEKARELELDIIFRNGSIYLFNKRYWEKVDEEEFRYFLGEAALKMGAGKLEAKYYRFKDDLFKQFAGEGKLQTSLADNNQVTLINLQNGTFEISEDVQQLREFRKEDFLTYQLPFEYEETANMALFCRFLDEVIPEKELQDILSEYLGSIFVKNNVLKLEKALFLYGGGSNGKSVIFDIISALLGEENFSSYSLDSLTKDKDSRSMISDKLLNYCSETSTSVQSEIFKKLVSREPIDVRQVYKQSFIMRDYAKLMFNANELPTDIEHNHAFFRRFLIIPFRITIPEERQDKNLSTKIIRHELPGIFNWILAGMLRLLEKKKFTSSTIVEEEVNKFRRESDSVFSFIDDNDYHKSCTEEIKLKELYQEYRQYCLENTNRPCSDRTFRKRLENGGFDTDRKNTGWVVFAEKKVSEE